MSDSKFVFNYCEKYIILWAGKMICAICFNLYSPNMRLQKFSRWYFKKISRTLKYHRSTNVTPAEHPGITEPYKTKNNCSNFKENLSLINTGKISKQTINVLIKQCHLMHCLQSVMVFFFSQQIRLRQFSTDCCSDVNLLTLNMFLQFRLC